MTYKILHGNNLDILPTLPDNSVDSIVTDPPYELGFMGKKWDSSGIAYSVELWQQCLRVLKPGGHLLSFGGTRTWHRVAVGIEDAGFEIRDSMAWLYGSGFPKSLDVSKAIDKQATNNLNYQIMDFVIDIAAKKGISKTELSNLFLSKNGKPTGWLYNKASHGQSLTQEQFEVLKDYLDLPFESLYEIEREVIGIKTAGMGSGKTFGMLQAEGNNAGAEKEIEITAPSTPEAQQWQGWGTALKPAFEPIVVARKPIEGTVANNVLKWGTGGLNIDGSRIGTETISTHNAPKGSFAGGEENRGSDTSSYKTHTGRWPANVILGHTEHCSPTGKTLKNKTSAGKRTATFGTQDTQSGGDGSGGWSGYEYETEVYACVDGCPVKLLDEQSGTSSSKAANRGLRYSGNHGGLAGQNKEYKEGTDGIRGFTDSGGASRFFYVAKASKRDRNEGLDELKDSVVGSYSGNVANDGNKIGAQPDKPNQPAKNFHPTVKPTTLMEYLIKLVTPRGGVVLDPFTGSGSTGKAAILQGFDFIGIEMTEEYLPIIEGRLKHAEQLVAEAKEQDKAKENEVLF